MQTGNGHVQVRLLGPVDVQRGERAQPVPGPRRGAILAALALRHREIVSTGWLVEAVWGESAPATAVNTLQSHISQLRHLLGDRAAIRSRPPGYLLDLATGGTDVEVAERLIRHAARSTDVLERAGRLRAALALWRGQPLADLGGLAWLEEHAQRLDRLRRGAVQSLIEARMALGEHVALLPELERLARDHAFDEQIHGQLILALYRAGRQADALDAYRRLRSRLAEELGIDPSRSTRDLEAAILRQDATLEPAAPATRTITTSTAAATASTATTALATTALATTGTTGTTATTATGPTASGGFERSSPTTTAPAGPGTPPAARAPAQLPLAVPAFVGRDAELADLDALLPTTMQTPATEPATVVISAVSGTAGVGKTTLAVRWAHRVADRFPDGQLYVNLRGLAHEGAPVRPADALRGFLEALGVPADGLPVELDCLSARYRSALAGRRVLILLDNARDVEQVRPLLPGTPGSVAVVTSRNQLTGLVVAEGARLLALDVLDPPEARQLLVARLGPDRVAAEPGAVDDIIRRCARLPLALAIAAARAAANPRRQLAWLADELGAAGALDAFEIDDPATDIRAAFSCSYAALSPDAARLFRLLGLHPGPECTVPGAARLAGLPEHRTRPLVHELLRASLLTETVPARFTFHDLLRDYARDLAERTDPQSDRVAAIERMIDHYLHTAYRADRLIHPHRPPIAVPAPVADADPTPLPDEAAAWAWLSAEHACLLEIQRLAAGAGAHRAVWQLAWALDTFHQRRGRPRQHLLSWQAGLAAAERVGDPAVQILARRRLGDACARSGQHAEADEHLHRALAQAARTGDLVNHAETHRVLAATLDRRGDHGGALRHATRALRLYRSGNHPANRAALANAVGYYATRCGRHDQARTYLDEALTLARQLGNRLVEANTLHSLGYRAQQTGRHDEALELFAQSVTLCRHNGDPFSEAAALRDSGDSCAALGDDERARRYWGAAHRLLLDQRRWTEAEQVRQRLDRVRSTR